MEIVSDVRFDGWAGGIDGWVKKGWRRCGEPLIFAANQ